VTGSARLDELFASVRQLAPGDVERVRRDTGAAIDTLVLFPPRNARRGPFLARAGRGDARDADVQLAIKPHSRGDAAVYGPVVSGVAQHPRQRTPVAPGGGRLSSGHYHRGDRRAGRSA